MGGSLPASPRDSDLWRAYSEVAPAHPNFAMRRVGDPAQIFSVFHELFSQRGRPCLTQLLPMPRSQSRRSLPGDRRCRCSKPAPEWDFDVAAPGL